MHAQLSTQQTTSLSQPSKWQLSRWQVYFFCILAVLTFCGDLIIDRVTEIVDTPASGFIIISVYLSFSLALGGRFPRTGAILHLIGLIICTIDVYLFHSPYLLHAAFYLYILFFIAIRQWSWAINLWSINFLLSLVNTFINNPSSWGIFADLICTVITGLIWLISYKLNRNIQTRKMELQTANQRAETALNSAYTDLANLLHDTICTDLATIALAAENVQKNSVNNKPKPADCTDDIGAARDVSASLDSHLDSQNVEFIASRSRQAYARLRTFIQSTTNETTSTTTGMSTNISTPISIDFSTETNNLFTLITESRKLLATRNLELSTEFNDIDSEHSSLISENLCKNYAIPPLLTTALREALVNAYKYAASNSTVSVVIEKTALIWSLLVTNQTNQTSNSTNLSNSSENHPQPPSIGRGLPIILEQVSALGGSLQTGKLNHDQWLFALEIPIEVDEVE